MKADLPSSSARERWKPTTSFPRPSCLERSRSCRIQAESPSTTYVSLYNPETDCWRTAGAQEVYQPTGASIWTGELLINGDAAYDLSEDAWMALPSHPPREGFSQVWTGDEVVIWGGGEGGESMIQLGNGLAYRPEAR